MCTLKAFLVLTCRLCLLLHNSVQQESAIDSPAPLDKKITDETCYDKVMWDRMSHLLPPDWECGTRSNVSIGEIEKEKSKRYADPGEYPSIVRIEVDVVYHIKKKKAQNVLYCNGFLITDQHVLTAASCIDLPPVPRYNRSTRSIRTFLGDYNSGVDRDCFTDREGTHCAPKPTFRHVNKIIPYDKFNRFTLHHDIAILQLESPVQYTDYIKPICLPSGCGWQKLAKNYDKYVMTHVGWRIFWPNKTKNLWTNIVQKDKRLLAHPISGTPGGNDPYGCNQAYLWIDSRTQLCTHYFVKPERDQVNCDATTGGPLILEYDNSHYAMGIASFGESCQIGRTLPDGDPLVMTWIPPYMQWILNTIYFLKAGENFPYKFNEVILPTGEEEQ